MSVYREPVKLVLAFAVGVSLSAGYVAVGQLHGHEPEVVIVEEHCSEASSEASSEALASEHGIELAALAGDARVPEGIGLWIGLDGLWLRTGESPLLRLDEGRLAAGDVEAGQLPALRTILSTLHSERSAVLWADHRLPGATIMAVVETLRRGGIDEFAFAVAGDEGQARAYRFGPQLRASVQTGKDPGLELSLRLAESGGVAAWARPLADGLPLINGAAQPLDLGEAADGSSCMVAASGLPKASTLAALEAELYELGRGYEQGRLRVEYGLAKTRSAGELLELRARASTGASGSCRIRSTIALPDIADPSDCTAALPATDLMSYLDEQSANRSPIMAQVSGLLSKDVIRSVARANIGDIRDCYNAGLSRDPKLEGQVIVEFVIEEDGSVSRARASDATNLADDEVTSCVVEAIGGWTFPEPSKGKVIVTYPFNFSLG